MQLQKFVSFLVGRNLRFGSKPLEGLLRLSVVFYISHLQTSVELPPDRAVHFFNSVHGSVIDRQQATLLPSSQANWQSAHKYALEISSQEQQVRFCMCPVCAAPWLCWFVAEQSHDLIHLADTQFAAAASGSVNFETSEAAGIKVVSRNLPGRTASLALVAKAGTRYEWVPGLAEALEKFAFRVCHDL
jgi:hypothetical protein